MVKTKLKEILESDEVFVITLNDKNKFYPSLGTELNNPETRYNIASVGNSKTFSKYANDKDFLSMVKRGLFKNSENVSVSENLQNLPQAIKKGSNYLNLLEDSISYFQFNKKDCSKEEKTLDNHLQLVQDVKENQYSTVLFNKDGVGVFYNKKGKQQGFKNENTTTVLRELYFNK